MIVDKVLDALRILERISEMGELPRPYGRGFVRVHPASRYR